MWKYQLTITQDAKDCYEGEYSISKETSHNKNNKNPTVQKVLRVLCKELMVIAGELRNSCWIADISDQYQFRVR